MAMHGFLRVRGRKIVGGGDEWFVTSRDELIDIYKAAMGSHIAENQAGNVAKSGDPP